MLVGPFWFENSATLATVLPLQPTCTVSYLLARLVNNTLQSCPLRLLRERTHPASGHHHRRFRHAKHTKLEMPSGPATAHPTSPYPTPPHRTLIILDNSGHGQRSRLIVGEITQTGAGWERNWVRYKRAYRPSAASNSAWAPSSVRRPSSNTKMRSAEAMVDRR